jgi:hypothetical protein
MHTKILSENLNGRDHLEDLGINKSMILKRILNKEGVIMWLILGPVADPFEHGNETSVP